MPLTYLKKDNELLNQFLKYLREGKFQKGDRILSERALAKEFSCSRNSLREVIKVLQTMGVLEIRKCSGIYVKSIDILEDTNKVKWVASHKDQVIDMHNVRIALEIKALELIPTGQLIDVGEKLKHCVEQLDIDNCSEEEFIQHDIMFHDIIWRACGNELLWNICSDITNTIYDDRVAIAADESRKKASYAEHAIIADAFITCDLSFIRNICAAHYESVNNYLVEI